MNRAVCHVVSVLVLSVGLAASGESPEEARVLFHVPFEGSVSGHFGEYVYPTPADGASRSQFRSEDGVLGKCVFLPWGVEYPIADVFNPERGTFSVWVKLETSTASTIIPASPIPSSTLQESIAELALSAPALARLVKDGQWHHFAYTWDLRAKQRIQYLDGEVLARSAFTKPWLERRYVFGDGLQNWIDELVLLDRPLSAGEVTQLFSTYKKGEQPFKKLPKGSTLFYPVDIATWSAGRPRLPGGIDWKSTKVGRITETRQQFPLGGWWRFQPLGFMERTPREPQWLYTRLPSQWLPYPAEAVLFDQRMKPIEGYNYWSRKMSETATADSSILAPDEKTAPPEEEDGIVTEPEKQPIRETGTYEGKTIMNYCSVVLERDFDLPPGIEGKQVLLRVTRMDSDAFYACTFIYLNGRYLGAVNYIDEATFLLNPTLVPGKPNRITFLMGLLYRPLTEEVGILAEPAIEIRDAPLVTLGKPLICPSYRNRLLKVLVPAQNLHGEKLELSVKARLYDATGKEVVTTLGPVNLVLEKDATGDATLTFPVQDMKEWTPETPNLYTISLEASHQGTVIDVTPPERFGYREVWVEGGEMFLNGKRLRIRGKSHAGWPAFNKFQIDLMHNVGMNGARTMGWTFPDLSPLDVTDEEGIVVGYELWWWVDPIRPESCQVNFRRALTLLGNHPSIVEWDIGGSGYLNGPHGHPMQIGGRLPPEVMASEPNFQGSRKINEMDPTGRPTFFYTAGVGGNVRGIMHSLSFGTPIQEMEEWVSHWAQERQDPFIPREQQIFSRPDYFFHRGTTQSIVLEQHARYFGEESYRKVTEPAIDFWKYIGKNLWATPEYWTDFYELAYTRALRSWRTYGITGYWFHASFHLQSLYEKRRAGGPLTRWGQVVQRINAPCIFYIGGPEQDFITKDHSFFSGETVSKSAIVVNETFHDIAGTITWKAATEKGEPLGSGNAPVTAIQGKPFFLPIAFTCPNVSQRTNVTVQARFDATNEKLSLADEFRIAVFPRAPAAGARERVALVDATGDTEAMLRKAGIPCTRIDAGNVPDLSAFPLLLVIGRNSYPKAHQLLGGNALNDAVDRGLNIVVLEQMNRNVAGLTTECFKTRRTFLLPAPSPLLAGLSPEDFIDWRGASSLLPPYLPWCAESDWPIGANMLPSKHGQANSFGQGRFWHWTNKGIVNTFCYQKPQLGNFRVLLENGFDVLYTPLLLCQRGRGQVVFSQLDLVDHYGLDPVATLILDRIVERFSRRSDETLSPMGYVGGSEGKAFLDLLAVDYENGLNPGKVAWISLAEAADPAAIASFVKDGGTAVVSIEDQAMADKLPVRIQIAERASAGKGAGEEESPPPVSADPVDEKNKKRDVDDLQTPMDQEPKETAKDKPKPTVRRTNSRRKKFDDDTVWDRTTNLLDGEKHFKSDIPSDPAFSGISLSDLYYREPLSSLARVKTIDGKPAPHDLLGVIPFGKGRIVYVQPDVSRFTDPWQQTKVIRLYNAVLTNLGVRSKRTPDFRLIGGYGVAEEWLPGYGVKVPNLDKRPMVEESPFYWKPALDFDPDVHYVW